MTQSDPTAQFQQSVEHIRKLNEQMLEQAKQGGQAYLDAYEQALTSMVEFEKKAAGASQLEWVSAVANAHATLVQNMTSAFVSAARQTLK